MSLIGKVPLWQQKCLTFCLKLDLAGKNSAWPVKFDVSRATVFIPWKSNKITVLGPVLKSCSNDSYLVFTIC